jgi:hypothetical protein
MSVVVGLAVFWLLAFVAGDLMGVNRFFMVFCYAVMSVAIAWILGVK